MKIVKGQKYWCWWESRWLWYTGNIAGCLNVFVDAADIPFGLNADEVKQLRHEP